MKIPTQHRSVVWRLIPALMGLGLVAVSSICGQTPPGVRADEALASVGDKSPVGLLYRAHRLEESGQPAEALRLYQSLFEEYGGASRWGRIAGLACARWQLMYPNPPEYAAASQVLQAIATGNQLDVYERQRRLWLHLVDLNRLAEDWREGRVAAFEATIDPRMAGWRIPSRLRPELIRAVDQLRERFAEPDSAPRGVAFFRGLLEQGDHPLIEQQALRHLVGLCVASGDVGGAAEAARAYWLTTVDSPQHLPEAINLVAEAMTALGADEAAVDAMRYRQMLGNKAQEALDKDILRPGAVTGERPWQLISPERIERETSDLVKTRLYLLDGQLDPAVSLLRQAASAYVPPSREYQQALRLIRMALALHDGHMHEVDRYERWLYEGGSADPLEQLSAQEKTHGGNVRGTESGAPQVFSEQTPPASVDG